MDAPLLHGQRLGLLADMLYNAYCRRSPTARKYVAQLYRGSHAKNASIARLLRKRCIAFVRMFDGEV